MSAPIVAKNERAGKNVSSPIELLRIPETVAALGKETNTYTLGHACGELLRSIPSLVVRHLDHHAEFQNTPKHASIPTTEFTTAVDKNLRSFRLRDGCIERFPDPVVAERKDRSQRQKYLAQYISLLEESFKNAVRAELGGSIGKWTKEQNEKFNKGVDRGLTGTAWSRYPVMNVCLEAGTSDWAVWLKVRCEEVNKLESKAGRRVFDDL